MRFFRRQKEMYFTPTKKLSNMINEIQSSYCLKITSQFFKKNNLEPAKEIAFFDPRNRLNVLKKYFFQNMAALTEKNPSSAKLGKIDLLIVHLEQEFHESIKRTIQKILPTFMLLNFDGDERVQKNALVNIESLGYRGWCERDGIIFFFWPRKTIKELCKPLKISEQIVRDKFIKRKLSMFSPHCNITKVKLPGVDLLTPHRFDIALKVHYARLWKARMAKEWREYVYLKQAQKITDRIIPKEHDGSGKEGIDEFIKNFQSLIMEKNIAQIPLFVIDNELIPTDGSHRISSAIINSNMVECYKVSEKSSVKTDVTFLKKYSNTKPIPEKILDEGAIEYCLHKHTTAIALIFPTVQNKKIALKELATLGKIVYQKDYVMSPVQGGILLRQVYTGQPWMNCADGLSPGFINKQKSCFPCSGVLKAALIDSFDPSDLRQTKERIRSLYGLGNHSIHITDSTEETLRIARTLFNENSLKFMRNNIQVFANFNNLLSSLRDWIFVNNINENLICVDGGAVLSALGIRECRDLDFLYHGNPAKLPPRPKGVDCHNNQAQYFAHPIPDIVGDPRLHFWYMGVKFCNPEVLLSMKKKRGEEKDFIDATILNEVIPSQSNTISYKINFLFFKWFSFLYISLIKTRRKVKKIYRKARELL